MSMTTSPQAFALLLKEADAARAIPAQPAMSRLYGNDQLCEALFASALQPSESPTAEMVADAISSALRHLGGQECARRMAQEFGDHPDAAASRMRWARHLVLTGGGRQ